MTDVESIVRAVSEALSCEDAFCLTIQTKDADGIPREVSYQSVNFFENPLLQEKLH